MRVLNSNVDNLIIKAKQKLEEYVNKTFSVKIILKKYIPLGAGLGGGSSNAASTLIALNKLYNLGLSGKNLFNIAVQFRFRCTLLFKFCAKFRTRKRGNT